MISDIGNIATGQQIAPDCVPERKIFSALTTKIVRSTSEVEAIRDLWSKWNRDRDTDIDYCLQCLWARPNFIGPHIIVIYRDGHADALAIGRLERAHADLRIGYVRFPRVGTRCLTFAQHSVLGNESRENCDEIVRCILRELRAGQADVAFLQKFRADSEIVKAWRQMPGPARCDHFPKSVAHNIMHVPDTMDEVYRRLSASHRSELRRKRKKLFKDFNGDVVLKCVKDSGGVDAVLPDIEQLAMRSYQRGLGVGFQDTEETRRWLAFCAERGWLRIHLLIVAGKLSAFWIGTVYNGSFKSDYLSYDPDLGEYSPGMMLLTDMIESICGTEVKEIDFGTGGGRYKERFGKTQSIVSSSYMYSLSFRGMLLNCLQSGCALVDTKLRSFLERTNLLAGAKKLWKTRLTHSAKADVPAGAA